jgi:transcriptional regulator with XRE-family HTH domain
LGLLQIEVAEKLHVSEATICNWDLNHNSPEIRFIPRIIAFLGYDPCDRTFGTLGERIIACRQKMGLSQRKFAQQLDVDPTTVARWERGKGRPSRKLWKRLAAFLDVGPPVNGLT